MLKVQVLAHSRAPSGETLLTYRLEFPRVILSEVNTHRAISKSAMSSRAIPLWKMIQKVMTDPYIPEKFSVAGPGMQANGYFAGNELADHRTRWLEARGYAVRAALSHLNREDRDKVYREVKSCPWVGSDHPERSLHKQDVNRLLEPFGWVRSVMTGSRWNNFFALRTDAMAHPAFMDLSRAMYVAMKRSTPQDLDYGQWHLPFITPRDRQEAVERSFENVGSLTVNETLCRWSAARCARTSYDIFGDRPADRWEEDFKLYDRLVANFPKHMGPTEHQGTPAQPEELNDTRVNGNLPGWVQYRKTILRENIDDFIPSEEEVVSWEVPESVFLGFDDNPES